MSEILDIINDSVTVRLTWTGDTVTNVRTGAKFIAEIDGSPDPILIATELGEDYRNVILLHIQDDTVAAGILKNDLVKFTLFGKLSTVKVLRRRDNPASVLNDFWAQQITSKDA